MVWSKRKLAWSTSCPTAPILKKKNGLPNGGDGWPHTKVSLRDGWGSNWVFLWLCKKCIQSQTYWWKEGKGHISKYCWIVLVTRCDKHRMSEEIFTASLALEKEKGITTGEQAK
jgi:hypothetical protein